jgi:hypothetical protein
MQNVTFSRVNVTIVAVEKQLVLHILSVCLQPQVISMNVHATYCHL